MKRGRGNLVEVPIDARPTGATNTVERETSSDYPHKSRSSTTSYSRFTWIRFIIGYWLTWMSIHGACIFLIRQNGAQRQTPPKILVLLWIWFAHYQRRESCLGTGQSKCRVWVLDWESMEIESSSHESRLSPGAVKEMCNRRSCSHATAPKSS